MFDEKEYSRRIEALFQRHQSVQSVGFTGDAYKPGLGGMMALDAVLGHPHRSFRSIHVAGTNGKGSVCSMLAASLAASGIKVGLYTSPHLVDFRERIKTIGKDGFSMIPKEAVWEFLEEYGTALEDRSFFEITTALCFWWFARENVDFAVIETGLGGRLDSTNIITPEISVITSIGLDHCAILGSTRKAIAGEKAGIIKSHIPVVVGGKDDETEPVFRCAAADSGSELIFASLPGDCRVSMDRMDLKGPCRDKNLATVVSTLRAIGFRENAEAIEHTAALTGLRGRWETLAPNVICDIAHNPPALKENFSRLESYPGPLVIVYGVMADKALDDIAPLMPSGAHYILAAPDSPRSLPVQQLLERLAALRPDLEMETADSVAAAVEAALPSAEKNALVYIGGSTFVVSEAIKYLYDEAS